MKFDMCFENIERTCNLTVKFSKYEAMLIFFSESCSLVLQLSL